MSAKTIVVMAGIFVGTFCLSCVSTRPMLPYALNEHYRGVNLSKRELLVTLPDDKRLIVTNPKDVIDDYGGMNASPESRVRKFYLPLLFETLKSFVSGDSIALIGNGPEGISLDSLEKRQVTLAAGQDPAGALVFSLPEKAAMDAAGLDSAVLITIERMTFKRNNFYVEYYWDDKSKRPANLEVEAMVLIWDYKKDAPVFYGTVAQKTEFQIAMQRKHWDESARNLAKKIVLTAKCL
jgi:hypothetical protein